MSTDTNQHRGRKRIELPPRPPAEQYESGVTFDVVHPDDGTERRITIQQPTQERYMTDDVIEVDTPNWTAFTDELPRGVWPGSDERWEICGEEIPALFCPDCGHSMTNSHEVHSEEELQNALCDLFESAHRNGIQVGSISTWVCRHDHIPDKEIMSTELAER